ncbi:MAG: deoxyguanosinetriphosphate triphosphohydrolase [Anaerolineae bacterium]|nr:deoxyguanosinetriphosphate triphosphohydrolase [Anaerolineae bacterium]
MLFDRARRETLEAESLAPLCAAKPRHPGGEPTPDSAPTYRTEFQRDRDRILHTTAFRRLEYKTQVFVNYEGDYYRTRLTHTLEVAQIGRTAARALGANEDLVEAICLGHDLGHPPFGHAGEAALDRLMEGHGGFEHNRQSYRIITRLEQRYPGFPGLNLTYETREGIVKHASSQPGRPIGDFPPDLRGSLEAQLADFADELAYNGHDLDDGLRAGLLTPAQLNDLPLWRVMTEAVGWQGDTLTELDRHRLIRFLIGWLVDDTIEQTGHHLATSGVATPEGVQRLPHNVVAHSAEVAQYNAELKRFLFANLYRHHRVVRMTVKAQRFLSELFEEYVREPAQLPPETQARIPELGLQRAVADYIAGMTDRFALQEWERLFAPFVRP